MEGFDPARVDEILKLRESGLRSVILLPVGYRADEGDWLVDLKKVPPVFTVRDRAGVGDKPPWSIGRAPYR